MQSNRPFSAVVGLRNASAFGFGVSAATQVFLQESREFCELFVCPCDDQRACSRTAKLSTALCLSNVQPQKPSQLRALHSKCSTGALKGHAQETQGVQRNAFRLAASFSISLPDIASTVRRTMKGMLRR
eukprot:170057-Rhodomonas_salina.1